MILHLCLALPCIGLLVYIYTVSNTSHENVIQPAWIEKNYYPIRMSEKVDEIWPLS